MNQHSVQLCIEVNVHASTQHVFLQQVRQIVYDQADLIRHHSAIHGDEASFKSLFYNSGYSTDMRESHSSDDEHESRLDTDEEMAKIVSLQRLRAMKRMKKISKIS